MDKITESTTQSKVGEINRSLILDLVRKQGPISRADIHRILDMSAPAVSSNVKILLDQGYITEIGAADNSKGRKATLLAFNSTRSYVVGIDLGRSQIRVMLTDLCGNEVCYEKEDRTAQTKRSEDLSDQLCRMIRHIKQAAGLKSATIECIAIGVPGIPDMKKGQLVAAPYTIPVDPNEIKKKLEKEFKTPVLMDNSVNYGAIGEKWMGVAKGFENILYINYGVGMGGSLIINNELFRGPNNASGEIGFLVPARKLIREKYDEVGSFESLIANYNVKELLDKENVSRPGKMLKELVDEIGVALINTTSVLNTEIIVMGGRSGEALGECFIPRWEKLLGDHVPFPPKIAVSKLGSRANVMGAVAAAIRFANDDISNQQTK